MTDPHADHTGDVAVAPHRLTLSAAELAVVFRSLHAAVPDGFATEVADGELPAAGTALLTRRVLTADENGRVTVVASVAANVATLMAPVASVQVEVSIHGDGLRSRYAVQGPFGASLITLPRGGRGVVLLPCRAVGPGVDPGGARRGHDGGVHTHPGARRPGQHAGTAVEGVAAAGRAGRLRLSAGPPRPIRAARIGPLA